jgi:hypothetical protein
VQRSLILAAPHEAIEGQRQQRCISLAPARLDRFPRGFTGHVAHPVRSILSQVFH